MRTIFRGRLLNITKAKGFVGVCFLDEKLRNYLEYKFKEVEPGRLFLSMAIHRTFDGDSDKVARGDSWIFKPDGNVLPANRAAGVAPTVALRYE
jgi:hypothetical protein